jgi:hypothetical protein
MLKYFFALLKFIFFKYFLKKGRGEGAKKIHPLLHRPAPKKFPGGVFSGDNLKPHHSEVFKSSKQAFTTWDNCTKTFQLGKRMHITRDELARRFNHHPPLNDETVHRHQQVRETCLTAAEEIIEATGAPTREQSLALTKLEEVMFWANAAIAREIKPTDV